MTSHRQRNKQAKQRGLSRAELELCDLVEEMLEQMRWLWILGYSNQFLLNQKLSLSKAERDKVLEAATRAVEQDGRLQRWQQRLAAVKGESQQIARGVGRAAADLGHEQLGHEQLGHEQLGHEGQQQPPPRAEAGEA